MAACHSTAILSGASPPVDHLPSRSTALAVGVVLSGMLSDFERPSLRGACRFTSPARIRVTKDFLDGPRVVWPRVTIKAAMNRNEKDRSRIGQPTVECPKCQKLVSPPGRLVRHLRKCSSGRRSILDRMPDEGLSVAVWSKSPANNFLPNSARPAGERGRVSSGGKAPWVVSVPWGARGLYSFWTLDIEAYPDPVQPRVEIITQPIGLSAEEVERLTTVPLEIGLSGMRNLESIRSISLFGLSDIKCYFAWDSDYYWDSTETINRLGFINLPQGVTPAMSPENPTLYSIH